ncbi:MAG: adenosylcobinamide-GDP ribazoletransferase [Nocardioidaceae bacterium]|nr:adenosylcobinamide-GDP ribazoletransferase [Nocardioidaceae bacterium]
MIRSLRLSAGMLTALPVRSVMDPSPATARGALLLAPLAVAPLGLAVGVVLWLGGVLLLPPLAVGLAAVGLLAVGSRALHVDGLSDVADGLTASHERERSLAVMKGGTAGPAGVASVVIVLGLQGAGFAALAADDRGDWRGPLIGGCCVLVSRLALWVTCSSAFPEARPDGLGVTFARKVPVVAAALGFGVLAVAAGFVSPDRGPATIAIAAVAVFALTTHCVRRFGGVTGDVFGAAIEVALAVLVVGAATF